MRGEQGNFASVTQMWIIWNRVKKKPPKPLNPVREKTATAATGRWNALYNTLYLAEMSISFWGKKGES